VVESATRSLQLGVSLRHVTCYCAELGLDMVTYCATTAGQCPVFGQIFEASLSDYPAVDCHNELLNASSFRGCSRSKCSSSL
jgi:hypothetical protein